MTKDLKIELNTGMEGATFETPKLNGTILALILTNKEKVDVEIFSELGYQLYKQLQHQGITYDGFLGEFCVNEADSLIFYGNHMSIGHKLNLLISQHVKKHEPIGVEYLSCHHHWERFYDCYFLILIS